MFEAALILSFSLLIDQFLGEPRRFHPLVGFGLCANHLEQVLNQGQYRYGRGLISLLILLLPLIIISVVSLQFVGELWWLDVAILYLAIGRKSLMQHSDAIIKPLKSSDLSAASKKLSYIVSRDTKGLDQKAIVTATIESIVENSNDAIFGVIFWYLIAGVPGVICYRLVNTLDAMWGYRNERFNQFGWAAAKLDDVMNWLPARLTVFSFAFFGEIRKVLVTAFAQGALCNSPNAGPVMAAGACSLNVKLGGAAFYQGQLIEKPELGFGDDPKVEDIARAQSLVNKSVIVWLSVIFIISIFSQVS